MLQSNILCLALVALMGVLLYAHTLHAPWYMDDSSITENHALRNLGEGLNHIFTPRGFVFLTFALNYHFGGLDTFGYHLVNIAIHLLVSGFVFLLLKRVFRNSALLPLLGALIFVAHPLQTQAVTYVVQRMTSLAGLFFFLALYLFVRARERLAAGATLRAPAHLGLYLGALLCGTLAALSKQNAVILPLAQLLFTRYFLPAEDRQWKPLILYVLPFFLPMFWLTTVQVFLPLANGQHLTELSSSIFLSARLKPVSPLQYLVTEFSVLWVYLRLLFIPYGQALDHSYPIVSVIFSWKNAVALLGLSGLAGLAYYLRRSQTLISFGIAWFFVTLAVESSIIPLDPLFEHRLYVPMFGFTVALLGLSRLVPNRRIQIAVIVLLLALFAGLSWRRNAMWNDAVTFNEDNLRRIPWSERVMGSLADRYIDVGRLAEAETLLKNAIRTNPLYHRAYVNLAGLYGRQGRYEENYALLQKAISLFPRSKYLLNAFGLTYLDRGDTDKAMEYLNSALAIDPDYTFALINLGSIYAAQGRWHEAENSFRKAVSINDEDAIAHFNLARVFRAQGKMSEALTQLQRAWQLAPNDAKIMLHLGLVSVELGDRETAMTMAARLKGLDPPAAAKLERMLYQTGR